MLTRVEKMVTSGASTAKTVSAIASTIGNIMGMINVEKKFLDTAASGTIPNTGTIGILSLIAQGNGDSQRNGNQVLFKDITLRLDVSRSTSATFTSARVMLICDKEYDGANPAVANVLQTTTPQSPINRDYSKRFVILKTHNMILDSSKESEFMNWHIKLPFHVFYDGANASQADSKENQILLLMIADQATNVPSYRYYSRINYVDN